MPAARDPEFYLQHADYVRALARHVVFDSHLAEDVEQKVWLAALAHAPSELKSPRAWLKALVRSFAIKTWRGEARRTRREELVSRSREPVPTPAEIVEHESARQELVAALLELDEPYRATLLLRFFEGLEPRQIAKRLDLPLETVRTRHKRALARLRERLERRHGRSGASLALLLVEAWQLEPPSYAAVGSAAIRTLLKGAVLVSATHKAAIAAAAIVALFASWWLWPQASGVAPQARDTESARAQAPSVGVGESLTADAPLERAEVEASNASESAHAEAADSRFGSLLLRVVWAEDQTPAAGVWMRLYQRGADDFYRDTLDARTRDDGTAFVERVHAGAVTVHFDRGATARAQVEGGRENQATLEIPAGFDVAGTVTDIDGRPFSGAEIYLQVFGGSYDGFVVARSGTDGSFAIRALEPRTMVAVSARAAGRSPTQQHVCSAESGETITLRLAFESPGGALTGRVLAPDGSTIAGARVLIGSELEARAVPLGDGRFGRPPAAQLVRTTERGEFGVEGLAPGAHPLQARAPGFAPWKGEVVIVAGGTSAIDVQLFVGASLSGAVRDEQGAPLAGIEVWANAGAAFASTFRRTDAVGSYAMRDLPLGEFAVEADGGERGYAESTLFGVAAGELRWDPVLSTGARLRVQLVAPGSQLAGWRITIEERPGAIDAYADTQSTDTEGRVEFVNVPDVELRLSLRAPGPHSFPRTVLQGVRARDGEVLIEPDPALEPTVHLRGRLLDPDGRPLGGASVAPDNPALFYPPYTTTDSVTGRFELGPLPAGEWSIRAYAPEFARLQSSVAHVAAGATWDFGDLQLQRGGTVVARLAFEGAASDARPVVELRDSVGVVEQLVVDGEFARSVLVAPGRYTLIARCDGFADAEIELDVQAGGETQVEVALRKP